MFYRDVHFMGAFFTADLKALAKSLPDPGYQPLQILPGLGIVGVHCVEYKDCDIGPYNEVSLSIPVQRGPAGLLFAAPQRVLLKSLITRSYHAYIKELPVTTEAALYGGIDFFNYPKYLADISFRETATHRICTLRDRETLDLIIEFEGRKIGTRRPKRLKTMTLNTYPRKENRTLHARMMVNQREYGNSVLIQDASLRFGPHPRAQPFKEIGFGWQLQYLYAPSCEAILFMPEVLSDA